MVTRAPSLKTRYSGYHHRQVPQEDTELTHVGPDTPCGEYLRRVWQPVCFSDDLSDLPLRVRMLGDDLVAFRDLSGVMWLISRGRSPGEVTEAAASGEGREHHRDDEQVEGGVNVAGTLFGDDPGAAIGAFERILLH